MLGAQAVAHLVLLRDGKEVLILTTTCMGLRGYLCSRRGVVGEAQPRARLPSERTGVFLAGVRSTTHAAKYPWYIRRRFRRSDEGRPFRSVRALATCFGAGRGL